MSDDQAKLRRLPIWGSLFLFSIPTLLMWSATRQGIPALRGHFAGPDILCWFVAGGGVFLCLFIAAFVAYWLEQRRLSFDGFKRRFRLVRVNAGDVAWSFGTLAGCGLLSGAIAGVWVFAARASSIIPSPQVSPPFIHVEPLTAETWWVLLAWLPLFFFNIAGEELWWRGYMLPRQEGQHESVAWLVHGVGLALFHLPLGIDLTIIVLPFLFGLPYVVQRRKNLWTGFIVHGVLNGGGFLAVAFGVV
jgi:membrane protease YdiL (CAAX protease family)